MVGDEDPGAIPGDSHITGVASFSEPCRGGTSPWLALPLLESVSGEQTI